MNSGKRKPTPPGEILRYDLMEPLGITQPELAAYLHVSRRRINEMYQGVRDITEDSALRLEAATGVPAEFWLHLRYRKSLWEARQNNDDIDSIQLLYEFDVSGDTD